MPQKILPSTHLLEMFMPYMYDEARMVDVLEKAVSFNYYRSVELPVFFDIERRKQVRHTIESNHLFGGTSVTPYVKAQHLSLADTDLDGRMRAVALVKQLSTYAADCGYTNICIPSGDDPGEAIRGFAKVALAESIEELADHMDKYGQKLTIEPLDRFAYKKQLIGPMEEDVVWFKPIHEKSKNAYIHWDSAHEALGGIDLMHSLELASPYLAQFHLCDAITDQNHPCFGDLHMDCAMAPDWETEGFLTPEVGAQILKKVASFDKPEGVSNVYASVEIHGYPGSHLWLIEKHAREFLQRCFELSGLEY
ncbi:MAG: sugar phosphate isomerase/epimerase family protein [Atopobiaceae bacterium]|jgi:sugar phosphate isomerase/epimerase